jgi:predicted DNA-binding transcriptional regulator YafY
LVDNEKEFRVELLLHPTYDFGMKLLSIGSEVKVLEPKSLQEEMKAKLSATLELYR